MKIEGIENVRKLDGNAIFASNHISELDPLIIVSSLPFFSNKLPLIYVVMGKKAYVELWSDWRKYLYGGFFFKIIGGYEAYRGLNNFKQALRNHLMALEQNQSVCIFPVGKRHNNDEISKARGGVAFLAKETSKPIIPVHIKGIDRSTKKSDLLLRKTRLVITFGQPIYAKDIFSQPLKNIKDSDVKAYEKASINLMKKLVSL